jgi:hypothetical protein
LEDDDPPLHSFFLIAPGPRPPYALVAEHLWGVGCDFDSDGDSLTPDSTDWTELTVELRSGDAKGARVDVDPIDGPSLVLWIRSEDATIAEGAAAYLHRHAGGTLSRDRPW